MLVLGAIDRVELWNRADLGREGPARGGATHPGRRRLSDADAPPRRPPPADDPTRRTSTRRPAPGRTLGGEWSATVSARTTRASTVPPTAPVDRGPPPGSGPSPPCAHRPAPSITSAATVQTSSAIRGGRCRRPTPYESGLAAVARHDVHIERVWPMRSPSTGSLEESSSAYFQRERRGTPPASIVPVGGLRMNQAFPHEPVMADRGRRPVRPGASRPGRSTPPSAAPAMPAALLAAHPGITLLGHRPRSRPRSPRPPRCSPPSGTGPSSAGPASTPWPRWWPTCRTTLGTPLDQRGLSGVLFDLGVSSPQLDVAERGFSYRRDAALDMRMDPTSGRTAADVVNGYDEDDAGRAVHRQRRGPVRPPHRPGHRRRPPGDHHRPAGRRGARRHPRRHPPDRAAIRPAGSSRPSGSPSTRSSTSWSRALDDALALLRPGGRCVVISYHSGEDRLVKTTFTRAATDDCQCPPGLPCVCGADPQFRLVTRGARRPSDDEVARNRRAEAARLRVIERLAGAARRPLRTARWPDGTAGQRHGAGAPVPGHPAPGSVRRPGGHRSGSSSPPRVAGRAAGGPAVHHVVVGAAGRREPAGRGGRRCPGRPGPGPPGDDPAGSWPPR